MKNLEETTGKIKFMNVEFEEKFTELIPCFQEIIKCFPGIKGLKSCPGFKMSLFKPAPLTLILYEILVIISKNEKSTDWIEVGLLSGKDQSTFIVGIHYIPEKGIWESKLHGLDFWNISSDSFLFKRHKKPWNWN